MQEPVMTWHKTKVQDMIRQTSGRYYAGAFEKSKEIWKSLGTPHLGVAKARLAESAEAYGVRVHSFLQDLVETLNPNFEREYDLWAYGRSDLLNDTEQIIIEIKPYNPEGIAAGVAQLEIYEVGAQALVKEGTWNLFLWLY